MKLNFFSFFLSIPEEFGIKLNPNFLETNVFNIALLVGLLVYGYQTNLRVSLEKRQQEIILTIENAQKDVEKATEYFQLTETGFAQSLFWLQAWKTSYEQEKVNIVTTKYNQVKTGLEETFVATDTVVHNLENKIFLSLQKYILFLTASRILRKFFYLSEIEQSNLLEMILTRAAATPSGRAGSR